MVNILNCIPNAVDSTSWYRAMGPLGSMRHSVEGGMSLITPSEYNWATIKMGDLMFVQRGFRPSHLEAAKMVKRQGAKVWADYDDLLFDVPMDNPSYELYADRRHQKNITEILGLADVVTVSTQKLKDMFQLPKAILNKNIHVVPNALDDSVYSTEQPVHSDRKVITWRGSNTHQNDLATHARSLIDLGNKYKEWMWTYVGWNPWFIVSDMNHQNCTVVPALPIFEFTDFMKEVRPAIHIVPLHDSHFNRAKSNIAWIEATYAGAAVLAPDWPEWQKPGVTTYESPEDFAVQLEALINAPKKQLAEANRMSWAHIQKELLLSHVNKKRVQILNALMGRASYPEFEDSDEGVGLG